MEILTNKTIKQNVANSDIIFTRGENIYLLGNYSLEEADSNNSIYSYTMSGNYGDYSVNVNLEGEQVTAQCSCPFPHDGCKHIVAACLDIAHKQKREQHNNLSNETGNEYLTPEEIRNLALESRKDRAHKENLILLRGETYKGRHIVRTEKNREYTVTIHSPAQKTGHCTCPDFTTNHLGVCKHLLFVYNQFKKEKGFLKQAAIEVFPFIHIFWNSRLQAPECYYEKIDDLELHGIIDKLFNEKMIYTRDSINQLYKFYHNTDGISSLQFDEYLLQRMEDLLYQKEVSKLKRVFDPDYSFLNTELYPYQKEGVRFALFKKDAIIADEMGLGKTLQAITVAEMKRQIFGFTKVLVITPASVKDQWKREIDKFSNLTSIVVSGGKANRQKIYEEDTSFIKITNYEAVMRDLLTIIRWSPDFIILDEAQRIKNFETKTHQALLSIPRSHSLVITGTPLENKLVDVYGIVQFSDHTLLTPLWAFAANHFNMSKSSNNKVLGYRNLEVIHNKLKSLIIRRRKEEVFDSLPDEIVNTYYLDLTREQEEIHQGYLSSMFGILNKKILTPMDIKRLQKILLSMRMVCDSTYLIDRQTNISPKLAELANILRDLVVENGRKVVLFSEWTTMTYLIGKVLSDMEIDFVELTGKIPTQKRQKLIDEFDNNPDCKVFLSSDAGGVGLNLQSADCVINFELPWNPARLNQRIGRVNRIGQKSSKINVVNLVTKNSIEEKVFAAINLKQELFDAVLSGGVDEVDFSQENKAKFVNQIRAMFGEEPVESPKKTEQPELDEQTPHFLNPNILSESENTIDVAAEEFDGEEPDGKESDDDSSVPASGASTDSAAKSEQLESVLNQGMTFLNALFQMATGKDMVDSDTKKAIEVDRETGEVVLRFKMPGLQ